MFPRGFFRYYCNSIILIHSFLYILGPALSAVEKTILSGAFALFVWLVMYDLTAKKEE